MQAQQSLDLSDDLAAGGLGCEDLPDKTFKGQAQAKNALTAVGTFVGGRQERCRQELAQVFLELAQGGLANGLGGAAAQSGQARAEGWEVRCNHVVRAVYIPPY